MTKKEKQIFEKWFEEKKEKCEVYGNGDDFLIDDEIKKFCLMGYELGLKEGRPNWHDLRKDPNDLPKRNNELTDRSDVIITDKGIGYYNFRKQKWYLYHFECDMSFSEGVIVWCEIPIFTNKE